MENSAVCIGVTNKYTLHHILTGIYWMYEKWTPEEVYSSLKQYGTCFVVIQNSICFAKVKQNSASHENCRLVDILDKVHNGRKTKKRFCVGVRHMAKHWNYFRLVFENSSFQVHQLLLSV